MNFPKRKWQQDKSDSLYRRGLYTYWQRTFLHPSLLAFDAPSREVTCERRVRSNTPVQSLVTLNDPAYYAAANALARRILNDAGNKFRERLSHAYMLVLSRHVTENEIELLRQLAEEQGSEIREDRGVLNRVRDLFG